MRKILFVALVQLICLFSFGQTGSLTVDKIMQDPKWIGSSPSIIVWSPDSQNIYFNWNPEKAISDSMYSISLDTKSPAQTN